MKKTDKPKPRRVKREVTQPEQPPVNIATEEAVEAPRKPPAVFRQIYADVLQQAPAPLTGRWTRKDVAEFRRAYNRFYTHLQAVAA